MEKTVLVLEPDSSLYNQIRNSLAHTGLTVKRAENLAWMHDYLYTHSTAVILVNSVFPERHCINVERHLKQAQSENIIVCYRLAGKKMEMETFRFTTFIVDPVKLERCESIIAILRNSTFSSPGPARDTVVPVNCRENTDFPEEFNSGLCAKQKRILGALTDAGSEGITTGEIAALIWPMDTGSHRDDIQSYVSFLRRHLNIKASGRYLIIRTGKRYRLRDTAG